MKKMRFLLVPLIAILLSGCAGLFIAGAATAVYVVTDPRDSRELATDQNISLQVGALGNKAPYQFNIRITANTFKGKVLLMGQAVSQELMNAVEADVRKIKGVKVVYNQMKVKPLLSIGAISNDTWITTKVKSAIIADSELREIKITVYTEDTEVFLTGSMSPYHADKAVDIARNISGVSKVVRAFYYGEEPDAKDVQKEQQQEIKAEVVNVTESQVDTAVFEEDVPFIEPTEE
ncbi:BON domain-containing protein [Vibrio sp. DW001]|uniref:BON domain-containing protein n=1 Tax=Vibrio sp. DW001 TaxID=2912315 RepID=UPI0023B0CA28|nr:BON domain-containing protein [Vibrio sp. DW001]WED26233.1 BON domain-containing protein [Vibrio sp. DW001]